ncbi:hypothetical protein GCK72_003977 [Caenorhabditis remanei]|uniref:HAT C-terminal dimerisation domain-containing protein n=1 Tax=Caenorhabditis remanei TaxID=31234 RepID=A0A6A5HAY0_CAERE|nr:hypothetical protein GCK72_003977 [Caenorhabditis remanei]KAF1764031.1 hypothetical protein GCK72_003977 [Caenorhabditis remanei]
MIAHIRSAHSKELSDKIMSRASRKSSSSKPASSYSAANDAFILSICTSNVSFRFVKNEFFKKFVRILDPNYKLISPDAIRRKLIENVGDYKRKIKVELRDMIKCFISLDGWDGKNENTSIYAVYLYFLDSNFERKKILLGLRQLEKKGTANNIGDLTLEMLKEYDVDISKVIGGLTDAGSNIKSFLEKNDLFHVHCLAHSLALILKNASEMPSIARVLTKVNRLASHLSRSKSDRTTFRERSIALKLEGRIPLPFCVTRWGGCCLLAKSYLAHAESDSSFASSLLVQYASLHHFISAQDQRNHLVHCLSIETLERYTKYLENDVCLFATYADPRYAYMTNVLNTLKWEAVEEMVELYCESFRAPSCQPATTPPPPKKMKLAESNFLRFVEAQTESVNSGSTKKEIVEYESLIQSARPPIQSCPLNFWLTHSTRFPKLSILASHFLSIPLSSAQVERLFSRCGELMSSSRRNRLKSITVNDMLLNAALGQMSLQEKKEDEDSSVSESGDDSEEESDSSADDSNGQTAPPSDSNGQAGSTVTIIDATN